MALTPRIEEFGPITIQGAIEHHTPTTMRDSVPGQWKRFVPQIAYIQGRRDQSTYGVWYNVMSGGQPTLLTGVAVGDFSTAPEGLGKSMLRKRTYAKFTHAGDLATIRTTIDAAMREWLPNSGMRHAGSAPGEVAPDFIEAYGPGFDPATGRGDIEVWVPVTR